MTSNHSSPLQAIEHTREAREKWYYPIQRTTRIDDGDWKR